MRALVADGRGSAVMSEVPEPMKQLDEAIVEVHSTSLNRGELTRLRSAAQGWRPGFDFAGIVVEAGADGPSSGTRVVGIATGEAWSERIAVRTSWLAPLNDDVSFRAGAALPVAGLTALRMLRLCGGMLGRRIAVTGAAGGVGRLAVQLAHRGGAHVTAIVGRPERAHGLSALGADRVVVGLSELDGNFDVVLESVGGSSLARLATMLEVDGTLVIFGNSSNQPTTFADVRHFYLGNARRLQAFTIFHDIASHPPARDLAYLVDLVAQGVIDPCIEAENTWNELGQSLARLEDRLVEGKIVLTLR